MKIACVLFVASVLAVSAQDPFQFAGFMQQQDAAAEPPGFSPSNNYPAELVMWLDARLYTTNGATTFWGDRWTNNLSATNNTAANRPTGSATGCNGVDWAISFDGVNDILRTANNFTYLTPAAYMFLLRYDYSWTNTPPEHRLKSDSDAGGVMRANATSNKRTFLSSSASTFWTNSTAQWMVLTIVHQVNNDITCFTNLNREFSQPGGAPGKSVGIAIGGRFSDGAVSWPGSVAQFVVYTNAVQHVGQTSITNAMLSNTFWWMTNYAQLAP